MCRRSSRSWSADASSSASAASSGASLAHSIPPWMPASRIESACRPSVRQRFTFVYDQPVISQISPYAAFLLGPIAIPAKP
jgi:hypothetical protein